MMRHHETYTKTNFAAEAMADPRTVKKIYDGKVSQELVRERVLDAARRLKFPIPTEEN
jgi:hypothetical protein